MNTTNQLHKATPIFVEKIFLFYDNTLYSQMLHECIWPYLIGRGFASVKMCVQPWAVSSRLTNDAPFGILCPRPGTEQGQRLVEHLVGTKTFSKKPESNVFTGCQYPNIAPLTGHHIHS